MEPVQVLLLQLLCFLPEEVHFVWYESKLGIVLLRQLGKPTLQSLLYT